MPFNGSGTFTVYTPGNPISNGDTSNAVYFNNTMTDFATGLSNTMTRDGQGAPTANIPMGNNKLTGLAAGTLLTDGVNYNQLQNGATNYLTSVSGTNTITASLSALASYASGLTVRFTAAGANTGAVTLNINSIGAINVVRSSGIALSAGDITSSGTYEAIYDGTSFKLQTGVDFLNTLRIDVASASTTDLTANAPNTRNINITGTTTITAFTIAAGQTYFVRFNAALTLTNNGSIVTQTGASISTGVGDTCILRSTAANVVEVLSYVIASPPSRITLSTAQNTTSGTSIDFTSIPSWVKEITVTFESVSTNGVSFNQIQIGSGSFTTSGYASQFWGGTSSSGVISTGFGIFSLVSSANSFSGSVVLTLISGNKWAISGALTYDNTAATGWSCAGKSSALSGALDRLRFTTVNGTDTFDAGSINILYKGY